jgi:hypothetical protein
MVVLVQMVVLEGFMFMSNNTEEVYAFIKDGIVFNRAIFDNPSNELLELFKTEHGADAIVNTHNNYRAGIGATYDGIDFTLPCSYNGWVLENYEWVPPTPRPDDGKIYQWNNDTIQWDEIPLPERVLDDPDSIHE